MAPRLTGGLAHPPRSGTLGGPGGYHWDRRGVVPRWLVDKPGAPCVPGRQARADVGWARPSATGITWPDAPRSSGRMRAPEEPAVHVLAIVATVFGIIFLAELPDKILFASLVLRTRSMLPAGVT